MKTEAIKKILILRFSSLGDIVMTTAMVRCVRQAYPNARIDMVVRSEFLDLIQGSPYLSNAIGLPRSSGIRGLWELRRQLNETQYDLIYDAHRSLRTRFLMPLLRARFKAYYQKHYLRRNWSLLFKWPKLKDETRFLERFCTPLIQYQVHYDKKGPEIPGTEVISQLPPTSGTEVPLPQQTPNRTRIGIIPSAQWPGKRWPLPNFRKTMEALLATPTTDLLVFGGTEDTFCTELCAGLDPTRVWNLQGKLKLRETTGWLKLCKVVVSNDTGLMHMADALNVPSVLLLGPTSGTLGCLPFHPRSVVLEHDLWCRPCSKNGQAPCIRKERYCLTLTQPEQVVEAVNRVIQSGKEA